MKEIDIQPYTGLFHDGTIEGIRYQGNNLDLLMESAEVSDEENQDSIELSKDYCINGILHIEGVTHITENDKPLLIPLSMKYEYAGIFDFVIDNCTVELQIKWGSYPPNPYTNDFSVIEIEAEKIWWENIPNLLDENT